MRDDDWSDEIRIFHDFNDGDHLFLAEGWVVWAGSDEGGMKVRLGKPVMHPNGVILPFEGVAGTWTDPEDNALTLEDALRSIAENTEDMADRSIALTALSEAGLG